MRAQWKLLYDAFAALAGERMLPCRRLRSGLRTMIRQPLPEFWTAWLGTPSSTPTSRRSSGSKDDSDVTGRAACSVRRTAKVLTRTNHDGAAVFVPKFCEAMDVLSRMEGANSAIDDLGTELHHWKAREIPHPPELILLDAGSESVQFRYAQPQRRLASE